MALAALISNPAGEVRFRKVEELMSVHLRLGRARRVLHRLHAAGEPHPGEMGLRDVALIQAMYESAEHGRWAEVNADDTLEA